jgi:hypothetical protein
MGGAQLDGVKIFNATGKPIGFITLPERSAMSVSVASSATGCSWRRAIRSIRSM